MKPLIPSLESLESAVNSPSSNGLFNDEKPSTSIADKERIDKNVSVTQETLKVDSSIKDNENYPGDIELQIIPLDAGGHWSTLDFPDAATFRNFYDTDIAEGAVTLHKWQTERLVELSTANPTSHHPYKFCLVTCNGSGKDAYIIASIVVFMMACRKRFRWIVTSSSGVQLTSQTENYIRTLCHKVNEFHKEYHGEIFKINQRYIYCRLSGSECRLFATDEEGKAEGYHPMDPGAGMGIIVNEAKSVAPEIHRALRRCTGFNYWLEISTPGEPYGDLYNAFTKWPHSYRVDYKMCPHVSLEELEEDRSNDGEDSPYFRSKWLALFTSIGGKAVIPQELVDALLNLALKKRIPDITLKPDIIRVGIDLAAGGDETVISFIRGTKCLKEIYFKEKNTEVTADRIDYELGVMKISKTHKYIYADDGGIGRSIIDKLVERKGWTINRILNQKAAINKNQFGNRGAEHWFRVKRLFEEHCFDVSTISEVTRKQLYTRHFKDKLTGGKMFLESKEDARANGRPSPDRADALILALTGLTVEDYLKGQDDSDKPKDERPKRKFQSMSEVEEYYDDEITFRNFKSPNRKARRIYNSLSVATKL